MSTDEKLENLARNLFIITKSYDELGKVVDSMWVQMATLIEVLAKKDVIDEEIWEKTLGEVVENMKKQLEATRDEKQRADEANTGPASGGTDEKEGSGKIITPGNKLYVPDHLA